MWYNYGYEWSDADLVTLPQFTIFTSDNPKGTLGFYKLKEHKRIVVRRNKK